MTVIKKIEKAGISYRIGEDTSKISSIRTGGIAFAALYPQNINELTVALQILKSEAMPYKILGASTNTFFSDDGYDGIVVSMKKISGFALCGDNTVDVYAGEKLSKIIKRSAEYDIDLSASLYGIPGTVGGAIRNNAGAFNMEISDIFMHGIFLDLDSLKLLNLSISDLGFSYRYSVLQSERLIFLYGKLRGIAKNRRFIFADMNKIKEKRFALQPREPSLGSFYKKSGGIAASKLIDEAGLKGYSVGGAKISNKHAGFIVNTGAATSKDVITLSKYTESKIKEKYGITLVREAEFIK